MTLEEIDELLDLKGWSKTQLAVNLDMTEAGVWRWFREKKPPGGPVAILIRQWLAEARAAAAKGGRRKEKVET